MTFPQFHALTVAALVAWTTAACAGPCTGEIDSLQALVDTKLDALAAAGPGAVESAGALLHHQPTPGSIAAAESGLGDINKQTMEALKAGMARARAADAAGDLKACETALADVRRALGP